MKKITSLLCALVISAVSFSGISNAADSKKPIVIPTHNWSSQIVMAYVIVLWRIRIFDKSLYELAWL